MKLTQEILGEVEKNILSVSAVHIKGSLNFQADFLSRQPIQQEGAKQEGFFFSGKPHYGKPERDLFACKKNRKVRKFSLTREQGCWGVDALAQGWDFGLAYAFPSLVLIPQVLQKLSQSHECLILIAPWWLKRAWFPTLKWWSIAPPLHLPSQCDLRCQCPVVHPAPGFLSLTAWFLRGRSSAVGDVRRR